jgi:hypothetical protein
MTVSNLDTTALRNMFPIGIILLAASYIGAVLAMRFVAPKCLDEPCQSEGVDNTVIMWGSDFFVAVVAFFLGAHLHFGKTSTRKSGTLAQIFMAGSFVLMGILHWMYPNDGKTDNLGMMEFWVVWGLASFFLSLSATSHAHLAIDVSTTKNDLPSSTQQRPRCEIIFARLALVGVIFSCISNLVGCVWCAITPVLHTTEMHDNFDENLEFKDEHTCIQIVSVSEVVLWYSYALLWFPLGILFRSAAKQKPERIMGLSTPFAGLLAFISQWIGGSIYFVAIVFFAWVRHAIGASDESFWDLWERLYGAEIFHLGILLTIYCAHNLSWSLTIPPQSRRRQEPPTDRGDGASTAAESKQVRFAGEAPIVEESSMDEMEQGQKQQELDGDISSVGSASAEGYIVPATKPRPYEIDKASSVQTDEEKREQEEPIEEATTTGADEKDYPDDESGPTVTTETLLVG